MKTGLFCNQQRARADVAASWHEDIAEIVCGDQLGFDEAWISEHTGSSWLPDALPSPDHMICALAGLTKTIRMGPAIRRLALYHPLQVAIEAAVCDQLTDGRYMLGFGRGGPVSGWGQRGTEWEQTHDMMVEGIDLITRIFLADAPFDFQGKFYKGEAINVYPKPMQRPHPPISVATTNPALIRMAVERGFTLLTSQFASAGEIARVARLYEDAAAGLGRTVDRGAITAVRGVYVADSDRQAIADVRRDWEAHLDFNKKHFAVNFKSWARAGQDPADVGFDQLLEDGLMFIGSPETVAESLRRFHEEAGGFGTFLLVTGRDWGTLDQRRRSMAMFKREVMPRVADLSAKVAARLQGTLAYAAA